MKKASIILLILSVLLLKMNIQISVKLALFAIFLLALSAEDLCSSWPLITLVFFIILTGLKLLQFDFYISTGFDLGIRASILHNLAYHGRLFDSLNQTGGFSGHIWPIAYPLFLLMYIWDDPRILLITQSFFISLIIPAACLLFKALNLEKRHRTILLSIVIFNIYLHRVSGFDFHPEALGISIFILGIYALEKRTYGIFYLSLLLTLILKEDVTIAWISLGFYYWFKNKKDALRIFIPTVIYGILAAILVLKYVNLGMMAGANYSGNFSITSRIKPVTEFFLSFAFLPILTVKGIVSYILPLFEHILSSKPIHYQLKCQYSAMLIPSVLLASIIALKRVKFKRNLLMLLVIVAGLFSVDEGLVERYIAYDRIDSKRKAYLDEIINELPQDEVVSAGNHITPHLVTTHRVYQFPLIKDADLIVIDTTWHDFTPLTADSGMKFLSQVIKSGNFKVVSDSLGVLILRKSSYR